MNQPNSFFGVGDTGWLAATCFIIQRAEHVMVKSKSKDVVMVQTLKNHRTRASKFPIKRSNYVFIPNSIILWIL